MAEVFASVGRYKSFKLNTISYILFLYWLFGVYGAFWILKDRMMKTVEKGNYGDEYAKTLESLTTPEMLISMIIAVIICALIGSILGKLLLKKHFEKAGIA